MSDTSLIPGMDAISASLGAATPVAIVPRPESKELVEAPEIEDDYNEARANLKELISQAMEMVPELIDITKQSQTDKMYTAAATFIKAAADLNISMSKLSRDIKRKKDPKGNHSTDAAPVQQNVQNNVYIGSTEDFLDMMENRKKIKESIEGEYVEVKHDS